MPDDRRGGPSRRGGRDGGSRRDSGGRGDGGRSGGGGRGGSRGGGRTPGRSDGRSGGRSDGRSDGRSGGRSDGRSGGRSGGNRRRDDRRPDRGADRRRDDREDRTPAWRREVDAPRTEAERRAAEVRARRPDGPRRLDEEVQRRRAAERTTEQWIDEGSVRDAAASAARRAATPDRPSRDAARVDPEVGEQFVERLGGARGGRLSERLAQASSALDRERFDEARRIAAQIAKEAPDVAAVQEVLGLASYRLGRYKQAVSALQYAQELHPDPALLPVIADAYRAMRRWSAVDRVWNDLKAASPAHEVMTEGRIVVAGAMADRGDVAGAIEFLESQSKRPKRIRPHHLREWYVLGDLYDRLGDAIRARTWFSAIVDQDPEFVDVAERLRSLGR